MGDNNTSCKYFFKGDLTGHAWKGEVITCFPQTAKEMVKELVHFSAIKREGFKSPSEGDEVEFEVSNGSKGLQATSLSWAELETR